MQTRRTLGVRRGIAQVPNDENAPTKGKEPAAKAAQKGQALNNPPAIGTRKRAALGDVTNASKAEKMLAGKGDAGKVAKPAAKPATRTRAAKRTTTTTTSAKTSTQDVEKVTIKESTEITETEMTADDDKENIPEQLIPKAGTKRTSRVLKSTSSISNLQQNRLKSRRSALSIISDAEAARQEEASEEQARKKPKTEITETWDDLDAEDMNDPLMVADYVVEIFDYMRQLEKETLANPDYMDQQKELAWKMRGILVDWLIEVHSKFRLLPETLFLAVNLIDRFLSVRVVSLVKLQLVGVTAMFVAAKYEEVMAPSISNFIYMADGGYAEQEILNAERYMLQTLEFNLSYPNPMNFLRRNSKADNYDIQSRTMAKYLMEISLLDHRFLPYPPSLIAAAGTYLARKMLDRGSWDDNLVHYSSYQEHEIAPCAQLMLDYLMKPVKHESFFKKYASKKFMKASILVREWINTQKGEEAS